MVRTAELKDREALTSRSLFFRLEQFQLVLRYAQVPLLGSLSISRAATPASSSLLDKTITASYTVNGVSASTTSQITARVFRYIAQSLRTNAALAPGTYGYDARISYKTHTLPQAQVVAPGADGIGVTEVVSVTSNNSTVNPTTGNSFTAVNSEFEDRLAIIANAPIPPGLEIVVNQEIGVGGFYVRTNTLTFRSETVDVANGGPYIP